MACYSPKSMTFIVVAVFLTLLISMPTGSEGRTCVFGCMKAVIACKRKGALVPGAAQNCCEDYYKCFMECKPDATELPPCTTGPGKRGSWNKRDFDEDGRLTLADFL